MPTVTSGRAVMSLPRRALRRRSSRGRWLTTSAKPMTESSRMSCHDSKPRAIMRGPPMPTKRAPGKRNRKASMRSAPSWSPESSPAIRAIVGATEGSVVDGMVSAGERALAAVEEFEHLAHVLARLRLDYQLFACLGQRQPAHVQRAVGALDGSDACGVETAALQAFTIDAAWATTGFVGHHDEGGH